MRVALDFTGILAQPVGTDTYMRGLAFGLAEIDRETDYVVYVTPPERGVFAGQLPENFSVRAATLRSLPTRLAWHQIGLPIAARLRRLDVVHCPGPHMPVLPIGAPRVLTGHDVIPISRPEVHSRLRASRPYRVLMSESLRRADRIIVPTRAARDQILSWVPGVAGERIRVIPWGLERCFFPHAAERADEVLAGLGIRRPYILSVATLEPRKNLTGLVRSYRELLTRDSLDHDLVLAGPRGWKSKDLFRLFEHPELRDRVHVPGYVAAEDLPALYAAASVFVYPSLEEGFGFPPLEAMASGVATIASDAPALVENLGDAALFVPVGDEAALAETIARVLGDERLRQSLSETGRARAGEFRWEDAARAHLDVYRELA